MAAKKTEHPVNLGGLRNISWKAGAYQFKVSLGYGADGKRKQKYERVHPKDIDAATENGVRKELSQRYFDFEAKWKGRGEIVKAAKFQTLGDEWLKLPGKRSESTVARYAQISERVYEAIGHVYVDKLTARQIQQYFYDLQNSPSEKTGKPLSASSLQLHRAFIAGVCGYAKKMGMAQGEPCELIELPARVRNSPDIYSKTEAEKILRKLFEVFHSPPSARYSWQYAILTPFIVVAVCSGLRRSEVLGLTWADTDSDFFTLDVNKQSKLVKGERAKITPKLKTDKSCRVINADPLAFEVLREYRVKQQAQAEICGAAWGDASYNGSGLIFTAWNGEILPPNQPYDWFKEFCKKFSLPFRNIHSLRHYRTSYRIAKGDNIYDVSADLGHCQLTTTLNLYAHEFNMRGARERGRQLKSEMFGISAVKGGSERD